MHRSSAKMPDGSEKRCRHRPNVALLTPHTPLQAIRRGQIAHTLPCYIMPT